MILDFDTNDVYAAQRARRYRANKKPRGGAKAYVSKWARAQFIAIDGEGENSGKPKKFYVGDDHREYTAARHDYTLLAASSGETLYRGGKRLETMDCLNYLLDLGASYKKAIFIIFAGGYDINHMLMYGFERDDLQRIARGETFEFERGGETYQLEYRARKSLSLKRGKYFKLDRRDKYKVHWRDKMILWDVFGFFQENFVGVMRKWLGADHRHFEFIKKMKNLRGDFANVAQSEINRYNQAELECLVELMQKVHGAINGLGLKVMRWDGAGAIAAAMFRKHQIKAHKSGDNIPAAVSIAARTAYAGGRIEICKIGAHRGAVYDYDINSAYPSVMKDCPCLACGAWEHGTGEPPPGFTLVRLKYDFADGQRFYPLFFRTERMQISYPSDGAGWYWYSEYAAAQLCPGHLEVLEWWRYSTPCRHQPFEWIKDYYETRKQWVKQPTEEWQSGGEKIIKLGLNSLYGKCAQQLGARGSEAPAYHQLEWAGYITASIRAELYTLAASDPRGIIGFATDGIFSANKLRIAEGGSKALGAWELKTPEPCGMTIVMGGVYWWHYHDGNFAHYSRGFDKDELKTPYLIQNAWRRGQAEVEVGMRRLIGMGTACTSDALWAMRGRFASGQRGLRLDGNSHKRAGIDVKKTKPHLQLVDLWPKKNVEYGYGLQTMSHPYPLKWLEVDDEWGEEYGEFKSDLELTGEIEDTLNI